MIIISKVEFIDTGDRTEVDLFRTEPKFGSTVPFMATTHNGVEPVYPEECIKKIRGTRFIRPDGTTLVLGVAPQAQEVLRLPFEALEAGNIALKETHEKWILEKHRKKKITDENMKITHQLNNIRRAGFLQRLRWLFTGIDPTPDNQRP